MSAVPCSPAVAPRPAGAGLVTDVDIPPCPAILEEVLAESRREEPDFHRLEHLIASDLALGAALLKTVNSPFYGLETPAASVRHALALLGLRKTIGLATGLMLRSTFAGRNSGTVELLWESSSRIAASLACLSHHLERVDRDEVYTFGLFRDCGMLVLAGRHAGYGELVRAQGLPHSPALEEAEAGRYGMPHTQAGFLLARGWYLPEELCLAVRHHHNPGILDADIPGIGRKVRAFVATGLLADHILAGAMPGCEGPPWASCGRAVLRVLDLVEAEVEDLTAGVLDALAGLSDD